MKRPTDLTLTSVVLGLLLSVVMGAANVYAGGSMSPALLDGLSIIAMAAVAWVLYVLSIRTVDKLRSIV